MATFTTNVTFPRNLSISIVSFPYTFLKLKSNAVWLLPLVSQTPRGLTSARASTRAPAKDRRARIPLYSLNVLMTCLLWRWPEVIKKSIYSHATKYWNLSNRWLTHFSRVCAILQSYQTLKFNCSQHIVWNVHKHKTLVIIKNPVKSNAWKFWRIAWRPYTLNYFLMARSIYLQANDDNFVRYKTDQLTFSVLDMIYHW